MYADIHFIIMINYPEEKQIMEQVIIIYQSWVMNY